MRDDIEVIEGKEGLKARIMQDEDPESPREWDNFGRMVCWHSRYYLGDVTESNQRRKVACDADGTEFPGVETFDEWWKQNGKGGIILPLFLYDHSGISMSTSNGSYPFNDMWDSGQVGWIYATADTIRREQLVKRISRTVREKTVECLVGEVKTYDEFLTGQVYDYMIEDADGEYVDGCSGFYGFEYCKEQAIEHLHVLKRKAPRLLSL